jgi:hypothetical protein
MLPLAVRHPERWPVVAGQHARPLPVRTAASCAGPRTPIPSASANNGVPRRARPALTARPPRTAAPPRRARRARCGRPRSRRALIRHPEAMRGAGLWEPADEPGGADRGGVATMVPGHRPARAAERVQAPSAHVTGRCRPGPLQRRAPAPRASSREKATVRACCAATLRRSARDRARTGRAHRPGRAPRRKHPPASRQPGVASPAHARRTDRPAPGDRRPAGRPAPRRQPRNGGRSTGRATVAAV